MYSPMGILKIVQEALLNDDSRGLMFSGVSIAVDAAGRQNALSDCLDLLQLMMVESRKLELCEMGSARGLAKDICQTVVLMNDYVKAKNEDDSSEDEEVQDERQWRTWRIDFAYLVVCRPFLLRRGAAEEDRSDNVRRVFCNEGMHQNVGPEMAYANTSTKEQHYAQKYYGFRLKRCEQPAPLRKRRRAELSNVDIVVESGLLQASAHLSWVQPQMSRWLGQRLEHWTDPRPKSPSPRPQTNLLMNFQRFLGNLVVFMALVPKLRT